MSKSYKGTKNCNNFINQDSNKIIQRSDLGRTKFGEQGKTDASHKLSFELINVIETHSSGAPKGEETKEDIIRALNQNSNLSIKSQYGNRVEDKRRDARIAKAYVDNEPVQGKSGIDRLMKQFEQCTLDDTLNKHYGEKIGDMQVIDPKTGRKNYVDNCYKNKYQKK